MTQSGARVQQISVRNKPLLLGRLSLEADGIEEIARETKPELQSWCVKMGRHTALQFSVFISEIGPELSRRDRRRNQAHMPWVLCNG